MSSDSEFQPLLAFQALPTLVLDTKADKVVAQNADAAELFVATKSAEHFSHWLACDTAELVVFLDAVAHYTRYVDRRIPIKGANDSVLNVQVYGTQLSDSLVLLSFLDLNDQERRNAIAEQEAHQRAGLTKWNNIYGFFREMEAKNRLILEAAGEGIYGINAEGRATFVNRAAQEMLGWSSEDLIGKDLHSIIHHKHLDGEHYPAQECPIYASFRKDQTVRVDDDAFWRKDGKPILVEYISTPIYDHGVLAGAVVIFRDVTERRENEKKLRAALAEVDELRVKLEQENDYLLTEIRTARSHTGVVGVSPAIKALNTQIDLAAKNQTNVLVTGPAGSGKSLAAAAIHEASNRANRPLIRVNCGGSSLQELEAELFGYRRGAFRGANRDETGKLLLAHNATLFLDEVADLPLEIQRKFSGVLQDGTFKRLGDTTEHAVSLTIISTTSRNLPVEVQAGRFRQDLYFLLGIFSISCDALKARPEDVPYLAKHFLERTTKRLRLPPTTLSRANIETLQSYDWPGNVRELENVVERAAILAQGGRLEFDFAMSTQTSPFDHDRILTHSELKSLERDNLEMALKRANGKVSGRRGAAALLGLPPTTVYSKLKKLDLS